MNDKLPWSDPGHDVGADMVHHLAASTYGHLTAQLAAEAAAERLRGAFAIAPASVAAAAKALAQPRKSGFGSVAAAHLHVRFPAPVTQFEQDAHQDRPAWKRVRRRPVLGGRVTHYDLDVDVDRIADQVDAALTEQRNRSIWTRREPVDMWSRPRQFGKRSKLERDLDEWSAAYERVTGHAPNVVRYGRNEFTVLDEVPENRWYDVADFLEEVERERRAEKFRREFLGRWIREDEPKRRPTRHYYSRTVPPADRDLDGWTEMGATTDPRPAAPPPSRADGGRRLVDFYWTGEDGEPRHRSVFR